MARARLEDMGGSLPVVFFPKVFDQCASQLRTSDPVLLQGVLRMEDERTELIADQLFTLEDAWSLTKELCVRVSAEAMTEERLVELRRVFDHEPGTVPIQLWVSLESGAEALLALRQHRVTVSADLVRSVDRLFEARVCECRV